MAMAPTSLDDMNTVRLVGDSTIDMEYGSESILLISSQNPKELRSFILQMINQGCQSPRILYWEYPEKNLDTFQLKSSCDLGSLFIDGLADGVWLNTAGALPCEQIVKTSFTILQSCRARISSPEYISCPSCGRTLFDLQKVTAEIRKATTHLKGIKIGIMGCIVNGPGEMADADYGYVGSGKEKVTLFKNKKVVKKGVPSDRAVYELVALIKESGDWRDP